MSAGLGALRRRAAALGVLGTVLAAGLPAALVVAGPAAAATCPAPGGSAVPEAAAPAGAEVAVQGHGYGHGLGMSQYGAEGAARLGCNHVQILQTYYRGTRVVRQTSSSRAVLLTLLSRGRSTSVTAEGGAVTWVVPGTTHRVVQPAGATWSASLSGSTAVLSSGGATQLVVGAGRQLRAAGALVRVRTYGSSSSPVVDLRMRWDYTRITPSSAGLDVSQVIQDDSRGTGVQKYLWGLREVPVTWPQEALRAQVVAARTYLLGKYVSSLGAYALSTTTADQNYGGATHEDEDARYGGGWRSAVDATPGEVVVDGSGARIEALYSSSAGGWTEDRQYIWGSYGISYLKPVDDSTWDLASHNPYRSWSAGFSRSQIARAFGFDAVSSVSVAARGSAGRVAGVVVTGTDGGRATTRTYTGSAVRSALGLRSPGVTFRMAGAAKAPVSQVPVVGDWDGDGRDDVGWFAGGTWSLRFGNGGVRRFGFGRETDVPVVGDWDGDGRASVGVFRDGQWFLTNAQSAGPHAVLFGYGRAGDRPVVGAWRGGRVPGIAVVRGGHWFVKAALGAGPQDADAYWGRGDELPFAGDWDGDGKETPGVVRSPTFYFSARADRPATALSLRYGTASMRGIVGDWNGDGRSTPGAVQGSTFYLRDSLTSGTATRTVAFGP